MAAVLLWYLPRYFYEGYSGRYFARTHRDEPREDIRFMTFGSRPLRAEREFINLNRALVRYGVDRLVGLLRIVHLQYIARGY